MSRATSEEKDHSAEKGSKDGKFRSPTLKDMDATLHLYTSSVPRPR